MFDYLRDIFKKSARDDIITLDGEKIDANAFTRFTEKAETNVGIAMGTALYLLNSPENAGLVVPLCCLFAAESMFPNGIFMRYKTATESIFGTEKDKLFINKAPSANTPPTKPEHMLKSIYMKEASKARMIGTTAASAFFYAILSGLISDSPLPEIFIAMASSMHLSRDTANYIRFNKVTKGEWVITDTPPPKEVKQGKESWIPGAEPNLV